MLNNDAKTLLAIEQSCITQRGRFFCVKKQHIRTVPSVYPLYLCELNAFDEIFGKLVGLVVGILAGGVFGEVG